MTKPFDAEAYLRQLGHRAVEDPENEGGVPPGTRVVAASRALCAIGAIDPAVAHRIVKATVEQLTTTLQPCTWVDHSGPDWPPTPLAVRDCTGELQFPWGRLYLHYAVFDEDRVSIEATAVGNFNDVHKEWPMPVTDDSGTSTNIVRFAFMGKSGVARGPLLTERPLSPETRWLDLAGAKVALAPAPAPPACLPTAFGPSDQAERYLWVLASIYLSGQLGHRLDEHLEPAAQALIAADSLAPDNDVLSELRTFSVAFQRPPNGRRVLASLREPWNSIVLRWREKSNHGLIGSIPIGVTNCLVDPYKVRVDGLVAHGEGFDVRVKISPGAALMSYRGSDAAFQPMLAWWAGDDLGNYYIGQPNGWHLDRESSWGVLYLKPVLDSNATAITLLPASESASAALSLRLPWRSGASNNG